MAVRYVDYHGKNLSRRWNAVLREADRQGVSFHLTSGHRTFAEQQELIRQKGCWHATRNPTGAACPPNCHAPHIACGRANHAIDVSPGAAGLVAWLAKNRVHATRPVPKEPWHIEVDGDDLARFYKRIQARKKPAPKPPPKPKPKPKPTPKPKPRPPQTTSTKGKAFLIRQEGVRAYAYNDSEGHATFGVGHLIHRGPVTAADRKKWGTQSNPKNMSFVMDVLTADLEGREAAVREAVGRWLLPHRFDACVSLCFNIGNDAFKTSTVARMLRTRPRGYRTLAANAFLLWVHPLSLAARRWRERKLFLTGEYT